MDPFESLLKAAQQIDSPNFNVKVVVEMKQQQRSLPSQTTTIRPTQLLSTPPRPSASSSAAAATMPPPPPPPRVQLAHHNPISNSSSVLAMPSLYSPYAAPTQYFNYYAAAAAAAQSLGSFGPPTLATAAMMMTPPSSSSPSSSWPYYHLNPRFSGHSQEQFVVPPAPPAVGHLPHPATVAAAQPLCLFPSTQAAAQQACQGMANPPPVAAAAAAAAITSAFRPIAERPFLPGANNMTFVSPEPKKSRRSCSSRRVTTAAPAATAPVAFLELKPSAQDDAPPEEEADAAAAATTPATATTKMRIAVTPDAEVNNKNQDAADDEDDEEEEEEFDAISTSTAWPVDENITLPALFDNEDKPFVNLTHYIIGSEILEPFVIPRYHDDAPVAVAAAAAASASTQKKKNKQVKKRKKKINFRAGTIAFRCRFCKHSPDKSEAPLATIYPETVGGLYRANLRFQAGHLNKCENCPAEVKERLENAQRSGADRRPYEVQVGVRRYWISTAARKGFRNVTVKGKERLGFAPPVLQEY
ncbi:hypothetical protein QTG54_016966 [Skeletonema marinoi]|uniref:Uncharacterized protein n=1 Tax=Skeletonema marinoi TaxID=267567 RepID=A0AAD8XR82_9STRA|nr:hypothetical protein QTG54_016966 [Skeletonema marinoi]